jgi:competence protein ComEC
LEVYYLDVNQGDAEILRVGGSTILIDACTNASANTLIRDVKKLGINKFDMVIGTHPHEDHIGGMYAMVNQFGIVKSTCPGYPPIPKPLKMYLTLSRARDYRSQHQRLY